MTRFGIYIVAFGVFGCAAAAYANLAPTQSLRPEARPGGVAATVPEVGPTPQVPVYYEATIRPKPRSSWTGTSVLDAIDRASPDPVTQPVADVAPLTSPEPSVPTASAVPVYFNAEIRPKARPWIDRTRPAGSTAAAPVQVAANEPLVAPATVVDAGTEAEETTLASSPPVFESPRPKLRPANLQQVAAAAAARSPAQTTAPVQTEGRLGAVCGNPAIRGRRIPAIVGRISGCGVPDPVQVTEVGGVQLSTPSTMNCETAQALLNWTEQGAKPAVGRLGGGIATYRIVSHYSCRTRNSQPGARISEHGKGRAIDIAAIKLNNGVDMTVLNGWKDRTQGPILRGMWRAACGPFGTVLGPDANRFHLDHFHFDTAAYRSGSYCR